jgi:hypothetical protein
MINVIRYIQEFQHDTNITVVGFNAKIGREHVLKLVVGK